jgi:hypothetical protein
MQPPDDFIEEYRQLREQMKWAQAGLGRGQDVAQGKTFLDEFRRFHDKWHPLITDPELREGMAATREGLERTLGRGLEKLFLTQLRKVINARKEWWVGEQLVKLSVNFITLMKEAPPELRPKMEKIHHAHFGKDFDPATHFRDAEADAAKNEADFRKALAGLEVDWPERMDAALRQRLEHLDGPGADAWQANLDAQLAKLGE